MATQFNTESEFKREIKSLIVLAFPLVGMYAFGFFFRVLTIIFIGQYLSTDDFDGAALGNTMTNITGYSMIIGLVSPMDSLCTQAFGARNWKLYSITVHRAILCSTIYAMPIVILWYYIYDMLMFCGYNETIAYKAYQYSMIYIAALPTYIISEICNRFLSSQGIAKPMLFFSGIIDIICHPILLCFVFIYLEKRQFIWAPICNVITLWLYVVCIILYCIIKKPVNPLSLQILSISQIIKWKTNWKQDRFINKLIHDKHTNINVIDKGLNEFIQLSIAGIFSICAEWWSFEVLTFLAGLLGPQQLAAHFIYSTYLPLYFMVPLGISIASAARIGKAIGENRQYLAKRLSKWITYFTIFFSILLAILSWIFRRYLPLLFTKNEEIIDMAIKLNLLFCGMVIVDAIQGALQGILRGIKQQSKAAIAVLIGPWMVTIPLACVLAFDKEINLGIFGMWIGNNVGYLIMDIILIYILVTYKWQNQNDSKDNQTKGNTVIDQERHLNFNNLANGFFISHFSAFSNISRIKIH